MRELLSRGADLQQPLPLEAHYQLYPQLSLIQILSESYANIAAPAESFLNPALAILRDLKLEGLSLGSRINALSTKEIALITIAASLLAPEQQRELIVIDLPRGSLPATHRLAVEKAIKSYSHSSSTVILGDPWHTDLKSSQGSPRQLQISKSRQTLGSALGITDKLAKLYAASLDARSNGLTERSFSLTAPRSNPYICSECSGLGVKLDYSLNLPRPRASGCPVCHGARFKAPVASTLFRGVPYYQILNQPITSSLSVLGALSRMKATLEQITDNGLAELPLGIPIALLSSSERSLLAL
jgi:excinuclease UvrABC ATPase subunit